MTVRCRLRAATPRRPSPTTTHYTLETDHLSFSPLTLPLLRCFHCFRYILYTRHPNCTRFAALLPRHVCASAASAAAASASIAMPSLLPLPLPLPHLFKLLSPLSLLLYRCSLLPSRPLHLLFPPFSCCFSSLSPPSAARSPPHRPQPHPIPRLQRIRMRKRCGPPRVGHQTAPFCRYQC